MSNFVKIIEKYIPKFSKMPEGKKEEIINTMDDETYFKVFKEYLLLEGQGIGNHRVKVSEQSYDKKWIDWIYNDKVYHGSLGDIRALLDDLYEDALINYTQEHYPYEMTLDIIPDLMNAGEKKIIFNREAGGNEKELGILFKVIETARSALLDNFLKEHTVEDKIFIVSTGEGPRPHYDVIIDNKDTMGSIKLDNFGELLEKDGDWEGLNEYVKDFKSYIAQEFEVLRQDIQ